MNNIKVCVFDAYGTLFDVHSASEKLKDKIGKNYNEFSNLWRAKQLEYSFLREIMKEYKDFIKVTEDALDYAMKTHKLPKDLKKDLMNLYMELSAYEEVNIFLRKLESKSVKKIILSNGSYKMLNSAIASSKLETLIDDVLSVEEVKIFKPNEKVYEMILSKFYVDKKEVLFFSSNGWDIVGATKFGFNTVWINRFNKEVDEFEFKPTLIVKSLIESLEKINDHVV